jgi:predicted porin
MKKALAAIAVFGAFSAPALAQTSVSIYGIADAGLVRESGGAAGSVTKLNSGAAAMSRLGFRGNEDLGQGLSVLYLMEMGFRLDTGAQDVAGSIFNRQAFVGLKNAKLGTLTLGRQYTPYYLVLSQVMDPFAGGYAGSAKNLFPASGNNVRTSNTAMYVSPVFSDFTAELAYAFGEQNGSHPAGRQVGASLNYSKDKLNARVGLNHRNNDITGSFGATQTPAVAAVVREHGRNAIVAANYNFGPAKGYAGVSINKGPNSAALANASNPFGGVAPTASTNSRDYLIGVSAIRGANTFMASYTHKDDRTVRSQDANQWGIGVIHALSKRTNVYASYANIDNKRGAGYTVGTNADIGTGDIGYNAGLRHHV